MEGAVKDKYGFEVNIEGTKSAQCFDDYISYLNHCCSYFCYFLTLYMVPLIVLVQTYSMNIKFSDCVVHFYKFILK